MEKYIIGESSSGKTRRMLEEAKRDKAVVVCKNVPAMIRKADNYGIFDIDFVSYEEMNADILCGKKVAVDELGDFFEHCFGVELSSFTMTID